MIDGLNRLIPEKHRFLTFLVTTSLIGVALIFIAVYNGSKELEIIHQIENLYHFTKDHLNRNLPKVAQHQDLLSLDPSVYKLLIISNDQIVDDISLKGVDWKINLSQLRESRVNEYGGYLELDNHIITWAQLPIDEKGNYLVMLHQFTSSETSDLKYVYLKRLLVPAIFYIWLMVWMAFIVRFLTAELTRKKQEMEYMALHDSLTGLPNRNLFDDRINKLLEYSERKKRRFAFVMMDLDGFKKINDTFGHSAGDALLKETSQRIEHCIRKPDTVARVGGDEFILLLDDMEKGSSIEVCRRIANEISKPIIIEGNQLNIGSSIGIANFPEHGKNSDTLNQKADEAMYEIKSKGGGILIYDDLSTNSI